MRAALLLACSIACRANFEDRVDAAHAGDTGSGGDAPAQACPPSALVCDGFESGDTSRWSTTAVSPNATLVLDTTIVHSGKYALHGTVGAGPSGNSAAVVEEFALQSTGMLAVREWVYQPQPLINYDGVIILEQLTGGGTPSALAGGDATMVWDVTENTVNAGSVDHATTTPAATAAWTCVELDYQFGSPSQITLFVNATLALQIDAIDTGPAFSEVLAGAARAQSGGTETIIDDVVIAREHIGCN